MKEINAPERLESIFQSHKDLFSQRPPFMRLLSYEKGELLNPPFASLQQFLLIVEGNIVIYHISKDGSIHHVSHEGNGTLLGDIEFSGSPYQTLFIEALEQVIALSIPFEPNRDVLESIADAFPVHNL